MKLEQKANDYLINDRGLLVQNNPDSFFNHIVWGSGAHGDRPFLCASTSTLRAYHNRTRRL